MGYIMLLNLKVVLLFVYLMIKFFKKVFMHCLVISSIVVYYTIIILNIFNKKTNCMQFKRVKY